MNDFPWYMRLLVIGGLFMGLIMLGRWLLKTPPGYTWSKQACFDQCIKLGVQKETCFDYAYNHEHLCKE